MTPQNTGQAKHTPTLPIKAFFTGPASTPDWTIEDADGALLLILPATTTRTAPVVSAFVDQILTAVNSHEAMKAMLTKLADHLQDVRRYISLSNEDGGYEAYNQTAETVNEARNLLKTL